MCLDLLIPKAYSQESRKRDGTDLRAKVPFESQSIGPLPHLFPLNLGDFSGRKWG